MNNTETFQEGTIGKCLGITGRVFVERILVGNIEVCIYCVILGLKKQIY